MVEFSALVDGIIFLSIFGSDLQKCLIAQFVGDRVNSCYVLTWLLKPGIELWGINF